jgi:DNA adenine methylase
MPPHKYYAELFGGSGVVLLNKPPAKLEIFNDINKHVFDLWKIIWDGKVDEVVHYMDMIFYDKNIASYLKEHWLEMELTKRVASWLFLIETTRNGSDAFKSGFSYSYVRHNAQKWQNKKKIIYEFAERIKNVQIINNDWYQVFSKIIKRPEWQKEGFIYLDPPYPPSTRVQTGDYKHDTKEEWHIDFLNKVKDSPVKTMISSYETPLYDNILIPAGWHKHVIEIKTPASNKRSLRKEILWTNYKIERR